MDCLRFALNLCAPTANRSTYRYSALAAQQGNIRLLRLLPSNDVSATIECQLFHYTLEPAQGSHLYEALSYVWGHASDQVPILIDKKSFFITTNLHSALLRLRNHVAPRTLWVDAVCIDQANGKEKGSQISLMAEIYAQASSVIAWLGEVEGDGDRALEAIRRTGEKSARPPDADVVQLAIARLLQRPWFRRIWVLQEMAAARHILIMCGPTAIDGHAFCSGQDILGTRSDAVTTQVTFLIRGANFRSRTSSQRQRPFSLNICSLGELIDMYHAHKATKLHDKIYALLGMCSDDLTKAGLEPDYTLHWRELVQRLVNFLLGNNVSVDTWDDKEIILLRGNGCIVGTVSKVEVHASLGDSQTLDVIFKNTSGQSAIKEGSARWTLPTSAKSVEEGDVICLFQGASRPTIVRLCEDHLAVVMIAANPPELIGINDSVGDWSETLQTTLFTRNLLLVWAWEITSEALRDPRQYDISLRKNNISLFSGARLDDRLSHATRIWDIALILGDLGEYRQAEEKLGVATEGYERVMGEESVHTSKWQLGLTPLCWAAGNGYVKMLHLLLARDNIDMDLRDSKCGQTPLSWAAQNGHSDVVKLLLETKASVDSKSTGGQTPLSLAAQNGHSDVVKLLLKTRVSVDSKSTGGQTPLLWAAQNGHSNIVKLLLETGLVNVDSSDAQYGQTPLLWAARNGHDAVVEVLLESGGKVDINLTNHGGKTPVALAALNGHAVVVQLLLGTGKVNTALRGNSSWELLFFAAQSGHNAVVKLVLQMGTVDVNFEDIGSGLTLLSLAAKNGHSDVVKTLLKTDKIQVDFKGIYGRTPLLWAAKNGHSAVVSLLLETGKVDIDLRDRSYGQTALSTAAENGHSTVVKLLLETGKVKINSRDSEYGQTPFSWAAENGHDSVVKLLLETGRVDIDSKSNSGRTPIMLAAKNGHDAVVKLLLETGKVEINSQDSEYGQTPLSWAAENGHDSVVKLLLETGRVDIDSKSNSGRTPIMLAAKNGHDAIVKQLLETGKVEINLQDSKYGQTPLSWAAENGRDSVVKLLLETGRVNIHSKSNSGGTPIILAAKNGHDAVVKLLLLQGTGKVDLNSKDTSYGQTVLSTAAEYGHDAVVKLLLEIDDVIIDSKSNTGQTPLSWAAEKGHDSVVKLLIGTGKVDVNSKSNSGRTPLSWAAEKGRIAVVKLLMETRNVNVNLRSNKGRTPLDWAVYNKHEAVVKLLQSYKTLPR